MSWWPEARGELLYARRSAPSDRKALSGLLASSSRKHGMLALEEQVSLLQGGISIVAETNRGVVGFLGLASRSPAGNPSEQWVDMPLVAVATGQLPRHIVAAMLEPALPALRADGVTGLVCMAVEHWLQHALVEAGFQEIDTVVSYLHPMQDPLPQRVPVAMLRSAHPADADAVLALNARAFSPFWQYDDAKILGWLLTSDHAVLAMIDGKPAGFSLTTRGAQHDYAQLIRVAIDPAQQRRGIGRQMVRDALQYALDNATDGLALNTQASNMASRHMYESMGFHLTSPSVSVMVYSL